jgi:hypothetical protein
MSERAFPIEVTRRAARCARGRRASQREGDATTLVPRCGISVLAKLRESEE